MSPSPARICGHGRLDGGEQTQAVAVGHGTTTGGPRGNGAVVECPYDLCGEDAFNNIAYCCGCEIRAAAKQSMGGVSPLVVFGKPKSGFPAEVDLATGTITVDRDSELCKATESVLFEHANLANKTKFDQIDASAAAGELDQEEFVRANERVEYDSLQKTLPAIDKCKHQWGYESYDFKLNRARSASDFDDYYDNYLEDPHKDFYRKKWDEDYKAAYEAKHPGGK